MKANCLNLRETLFLGKQVMGGIEVMEGAAEIGPGSKAARSYFTRCAVAFSARRSINQWLVVSHSLRTQRGPHRGVNGPPKSTRQPIPLRKHKE